MEKHSVSKMIGSPPGYVGYDDAGQLTEKVRRRPYSVILLDEIEKAHADVHNILLQLLDDGKITDSHGKTVDFRNTVIIMTSNAGSNESAGIYGFGTQPDGREERRAEEGLKRVFRPEFLNRIDEIITFHSLTKEEIREIAALQIRELVCQAAQSGLSLDVDSSVAGWVAEKGYSHAYGARPIRRVIQKEIEDPLSMMLIGTQLAAGDTLQVTAGEQGLQFDKKEV